jgi:predicted enzyme related to lactoylglutathione lyase
LDPLDKEADTAAEKWYGFDTGTVQFAIEPMSNRDKYKFDYEKKNPVLIQFKAVSMEDLTQMTERLEKAGVVIGQRIMKKSYGTVTTFVDPDGNVIELLYTE